MVENLSRFFFGIVLTIFLSRYFGPRDYGLFIYVYSISSFMILICKMGMDTIMIKDLLTKNYSILNQTKLHGSIFWTLQVYSLIIYIISVLLFWKLEDNYQTKIIFSLFLTNIFFTSFLSIEYFYNSKFKSKISSSIKIFSYLFFFLIKIYFIHQQENLEKIIIIFVLENLFISFFLVLSFKYEYNLKFLTFFDKKIFLKIFKTGLILSSSSLLTFIQLRIDTVMIRNILSFEDLGKYSVSTKIYESWIFFITIFTLATFPTLALYRKQNYKKFLTYFKKLMSVIVLLSLIISLICFNFDNLIIDTLFGEVYSKNNSVLKIIIWSSIFSAMGSFTNRFLILQNIEKNIFERTLIGSLLNIILNYYLISRYGINGAAISTLITLLYINYFHDLLKKDTRNLFLIKSYLIFEFFKPKKKYKKFE